MTALWGRGPRAACMRITNRASPFISKSYLLDRDIVRRSGDGIFRSALLRLERRAEASAVSVTLDLRAGLGLRTVSARWRLQDGAPRWAPLTEE